MSRFSSLIAELERRPIFPDRAPGLEKIQHAMEELGFTDRVGPDRVIVVAGTNGKGSTCATLEALLLSAGKATGFYSSPHLITTTERIRIDGKDISENDFCTLYDELLTTFEKYELSHFEALTLMAVKAFLDRDLDFMIFEVGLGGIWDATNAIPHTHSVITPIDFDHTQLLGKTITEIARNKFGIVHKNNIVCYAPLSPDVLPLQEQTQKDTHSTWIPRKNFTTHIENDKTYNPRFFITYNNETVELALPGQRGAENTALALTIFEQLGFDAGQHMAALKKVDWPGRMECIDGVYLSGDHNAQGIRSLREVLSHYKWPLLHLIVGIGEGKEVETMLSYLVTLPNSKLYLTKTTFKPRELKDYGGWLDKAAHVEADPLVMLDHVRGAAQKDDMIVVTGSLYLVGAVRGSLLGLSVL